MYEVYNGYDIKDDYIITSISGNDMFYIDNCIQGFRHCGYILDYILQSKESEEYKQKEIREISETLYRLGEELKKVSIVIKQNKLSKTKFIYEKNK